MDKIYVLDASGYLYRSYFAIRNMTNPKGESTNALYGFIRSVLKLFKDFDPHHFVAVFDGPQNAMLREAIYADYKAHRETMPPDLRYQIEWARTFCKLMGIPLLNVTGVEADDTMGTVALWAKTKGAMVYLCTSDKDMCQVVDEHIHLLNTHKENTIIDPKTVEEIHGVRPDQFIDYLSITGDSSDNIPGLKGLGPKTAASLLKEFGTLESLLANPEKLSGKKQEIIMRDAHLARISKQLVALKIDVEIPLDENFYFIQKPELVGLKEFYTEMHFNSLLKELDLAFPGEAKPAAARIEEYILVDTEEAFVKLLDELAKEPEICVDTETTHYLPLKAELVGIGFGTELGKARYVPVNGFLGLKRVLQGIKPLLENPSIGFYGHNIKYDYQILANEGITIATICFDTILASYILDSQKRQHSLDTLALEYFGKVKIATTALIGKGKNQITMREVPIDKVCTYCCEDVDYTLRLKLLFQDQLKDRKLEKLFKEIELPLIKVLADMERQGVYLDLPCLEKQAVDLNRMLRVLETEIYALAGETFNINSPKQLSEILFTKMGIKPPKKTATGHSTNADVLESLAHAVPLAGKILEYRTLEKLRSTYAESLPSEVHLKTGRIHCTFNQSVAATGRLSCQDPNLQNIPVKTEAGKKIREAFRPERKGWSYLAADYSQIELRLLAHLSEDPVLIDAFKQNRDIHALTASQIYNIPLESVTKEQRNSAKAVNFGVIYGQGAYGLSEQLGVDRKEAAAFIEMYFKQFPSVKGYLEACKEKARRTGKASTITGRERALPDIHSKEQNIRSAAERLAVNTPLQGTAADLIKLAMLRVEHAMKKANTIGFMVLQIHDELIFEVPDFEIISLEPMIRDIMQNVWKLKVPLVVDIEVGKNWKEC